MTHAFRLSTVLTIVSICSCASLLDIEDAIVKPLAGDGGAAGSADSNGGHGGGAGGSEVTTSHGGMGAGTAGGGDGGGCSADSCEEALAANGDPNLCAGPEKDKYDALILCACTKCDPPRLCNGTCASPRTWFEGADFSACGSCVNSFCPALYEGC